MVVATTGHVLQQLFRAVNERLRDRMERLSFGGRYPVICECSNPDCLEVIEVRRSEYSQVRESPNRYILAPGHARPELETVVEKREAFEIAEKKAASSDSADPAEREPQC